MHKEIVSIIVACENLRSQGFTVEAEKLSKLALQVEADHINAKLDSINRGNSLFRKNHLCLVATDL
jgi:hypothetical protein